MMKTLVTAAALALCAISVPAFVSHSQAAPAAKNPYCALAKTQKNPTAWNEFYGCWTTSPKTHVAAARTDNRTYNDASTYDSYDDPSYCKMANSQKNPTAWNEFYHCWKH